MSQPATLAAPRKTGRRLWPRWVGYIGWSLLGLLAITGLVAFLTVQFGAVHGVELNPFTFARRSYSFYEIPLVRLQVRSIRREDVASITEDFLAQQKYVAPIQGAPDVWHVVLLARGTSKPIVGDADILVRYLESKDNEDYHAWVKWSEQNPKLAAALWPAVSRLCQTELYIFVPELFDLARGTSDPVVFQSKLNQEVAARLYDLAQTLQTAEEYAQAKKLLDDAARLDAQNPLIKRAQEIAAAKVPSEPTPPQKKK